MPKLPKNLMWWNIASIIITWLILINVCRKQQKPVKKENKLLAYWTILSILLWMLFVQSLVYFLPYIALYLYKSFNDQEMYPSVLIDYSLLFIVSTLLSLFIVVLLAFAQPWKNDTFRTVMERYLYPKERRKRNFVCCAQQFIYTLFTALQFGVMAFIISINCH